MAGNYSGRFRTQPALPQHHRLKSTGNSLFYLFGAEITLRTYQNQSILSRAIYLGEFFPLTLRIAMSNEFLSIERTGDKVRKGLHFGQSG